MELLIFIAGTILSLLMGRDSCRNLTNPEDFAGFWILYKKDVPIFQRKAIWVYYLSALSFLVETFFSARSSTSTKKRKRLMSERVKKVL